MRSCKSFLVVLVSFCLLSGISDHRTENWESHWGLASPVVFCTLLVPPWGRGQRGLGQGLICNKPVGCKGPRVLHNCPPTPQGSHPVYPLCS